MNGSKDFTKAIRFTTRILDAWLPWKIQYDRMPGLAVGIVYRGKLLYQKGFGFADVEEKIPITPKTAFRIASISKTFTAVAMMQLVERGKIHLDDRIEKYLPWFAFRKKHLNSSSITVRQLMAHSSGVIRDGDTPHWATGKFPSLAGLKKALSHDALVFENLAQFKYSNFGFALLGQIITKVTGLSYDAYIQRQILQPLRMTRSATDLTHANRNWLAKGYMRPIPGEARAWFPHEATNVYAPATGFLSTVPDLARYLSALSIRKSRRTLLDRESKKELFQQYWVTDTDGDGYGLGFSIDKIDRRKIVGHGGGFPGFITQIRLDVENDFGVITLSNTNNSTSGQINWDIFRTVYQLVDQGNRYFSGKRVADPRRYAGVYREPWGDAIIVPLGNVLIEFDPTTNTLLKNATILRPKTKAVFSMEIKEVFDSPGETAKFIFRGHAQKAQTYVRGSTPYERIE